ncbi:hypothetical protein M3Y98_00296100 [Aphelenchoides besseyi]|nr:hypothetical protein M3Y98_00296100 [Aphelenchoides besseyi]KAI6201176.1 hypothetical protein M3Y96_00814100 [Aphelenchoides besseyi]
MLRFCLLLILLAWMHLFIAADSVYYEQNTPQFIELINERQRRDVKTSTPLDIGSEDARKFPTDIEVEEDRESEHVYYKMSTFTNKSDVLKDHYVDVSEWLKQPGIEGHRDHPSLQESYRKAASAPIGFSFPFYGHPIENLTIATGGFCYVGDQTHSWLAATQYVAPLMANFDTVADNASITYATDKKTKMVIAWNNVRLRDNPRVGFFNFQVHLWSSGDIWFVYKDIPVEVKDISDAHHPCKLGISDAYLFNHRFGDKSSTQMKRVIHEYHRIQVPVSSVTSNTVVILKALPTCLQYTDCQSCTGSTLKTFNCSWCNPNTANVSAFCSDQAGLHRRRQEWVEGDCAREGLDKTCPAPEVESTTTFSTTEVPVTAPPVDIEQEKEKLSQKNTGSGGGMAIFTVLFIVLLAAGCWVVYAFYNPHTTSGQLLIKYRPSKWQLPSAHVRYSATSGHI